MINAVTSGDLFIPRDKNDRYWSKRDWPCAQTHTKRLICSLNYVSQMAPRDQVIASKVIAWRRNEYTANMQQIRDRVYINLTYRQEIRCWPFHGGSPRNHNV